MEEEVGMKEKRPLEKPQLMERVRPHLDAYDQADWAGKLKMMNHVLEFFIDDVGAGWEYVHILLDQKLREDYRISEIGPGVKAFVRFVFSLEEQETKQFAWYDEPGEYHWIFSRKNAALYIEAPGLEEGFFVRYFAFRDGLRKEYERVYGWGFRSEIERIPLCREDLDLLRSLDVSDGFELVRFTEDGQAFETTDSEEVKCCVAEVIRMKGMEDGKLNEYGEALRHLYQALKSRETGMEQNQNP